MAPKLIPLFMSFFSLGEYEKDIDLKSLEKFYLFIPNDFEESLKKFTEELNYIKKDI